ncbi:MAG: hypothetical protein MZV49_00850 [Rhodopseudomonas palustris]|nr:hypothetical protein [Rhodopseudomonas palustris]
MMSNVLSWYPTLFFLFRINMILFELIVEFIESLPAPNTTTCTTDPQTIYDIADCAKAHETIEKGNYKNVTPFVKYVEQVNEFNNRKTVAGHTSK